MFTLATLTYNRFKLLRDNLTYPLSLDTIEKIIINDDCSHDYNLFDIYLKSTPNTSKITLYRNSNNLGCFKNKMQTLSLSDSKWTILMDSDNSLRPEYLNSLHDIELDESTVYCPTILYKPNSNKVNFSFPSLENVIVDKKMWSKLFLLKENNTTAFNVCNFIISKKVSEYLIPAANEYMKQHNYIPTAYDSIVISNLILQGGFKMHFIKNMAYNHPTEHNEDINMSNYKQFINTSKSLTNTIETFNI